MKLYATVTSERASKGQGGNKFVRANFSIGSAKDSQEVLSIVLDENGVFTIRDKNHEVFRVIEIRGFLLSDVTKRGERQKGDSCEPCTDKYSRVPHTCNQ